MPVHSRGAAAAVRVGPPRAPTRSVYGARVRAPATRVRAVPSASHAERSSDATNHVPNDVLDLGKPDGDKRSAYRSSQRARAHDFTSLAPPSSGRHCDAAPSNHGERSGQSVWQSPSSSGGPMSEQHVSAPPRATRSSNHAQILIGAVLRVHDPGVRVCHRLPHRPLPPTDAAAAAVARSPCVLWPQRPLVGLRQPQPSDYFFNGAQRTARRASFPGHARRAWARCVGGQACCCQCWSPHCGRAVLPSGGLSPITG